MAKKRFFKNRQPYHILNRGVEKRNIFLDEVDYHRFIFLFYACNLGRPASNLWRRDIIRAGRIILSGKKLSQNFINKEGPSLVKVIAFALMPNHFHFILEQENDGGISRFMQKISNAYAKYFNAKNQRQGRLFQAPFQAILVKNDVYFLNLLRYVHLNVLDFVQPDWRTQGVGDYQKAINQLREYPWSSAPDYFRMRSSAIMDPGITGSRKMADKFFNNFNKQGVAEFKRFLLKWSKDDFNRVRDLSLEDSLEKNGLNRIRPGRKKSIKRKLSKKLIKKSRLRKVSGC
jgi:putative transposase